LRERERERAVKKGGINKWCWRISFRIVYSLVSLYKARLIILLLDFNRKTSSSLFLEHLLLRCCLHSSIYLLCYYQLV
jgi:hypothetical protein